MEKILTEDDLITTKTDLKGNIIYASDDFLFYADYEMHEVLNKPHNIVRHPDMPSAAFKLLWDYIKDGKEFFAFVKNLSKKGDFYWVFANISPSFDEYGKIVSYYSVRRKPNAKALPIIQDVYSQIKQAEKAGGLQAGVDKLLQIVASHNLEYNNLIFHLQNNL